MSRKINLGSLNDFVADIESKLKHCPFCGSAAKLENNVGSWDNDPEFEIICSNDRCFLSETGLTPIDLDEWQELNLDSLTGLKKILRIMKKVWNNRAAAHPPLGTGGRNEL